MASRVGPAVTTNLTRSDYPGAPAGIPREKRSHPLSTIGRCFVAARQHSFFGPDEFDAAFFQCGHILLRRRVFPHFPVHGGRDKDLGAGGERDGGKRVTRESIRELCDDVRRRRCDEKKVRAISELDMSGPPVFFFVEEAGADGILRKRLERERRDEFDGVASHHNENIVTLFHEQTRQLRGFVAAIEPVTPRTTHFRFGSELICGKSSKHQAPSAREGPNTKLQ